VYPVPVSPIIHLLRVEFGGENIAQYRLLVNTNVEARHATWFNGEGLNDEWEMTNSDGGGWPLAVGTTVRIQVKHERDSVADFWARLQYREIK
jgi:hypothetical protein